MRHSVRWGWIALSAVCGAAIATALVGAAVYFAEEWNHVAVIRDISAKTVISVPNGKRKLDVHYGSAALPRCPNVAQHVLFKVIVGSDGKPEHRIVSLNGPPPSFGKGFDGQIDLPFDIPDTVDSGAWFYTAIILTGCELIPGLQRWRSEITKPVSVWVPPPK